MLGRHRSAKLACEMEGEMFSTPKVNTFCNYKILNSNMDLSKQEGFYKNIENRATINVLTLCPETEKDGNLNNLFDSQGRR